MSATCYRDRPSRPRRLVLAALSSLLLSLPAALQAQGLPTVKPDEVGLSSQRLAGIGSWLRTEVAQKKIPGAVIMVVRGGKVAYLDVVGQRGPDNPAPMKVDDIFRIYSMTKPIVSVAALMLVEEGRLLLDAPVARYIPAFANVKVGIEKTDASGQKTLDLVPPRRPMTVQDLMRHTSGLTYGFFGDGLVKKAYQEAGITAGGDITNQEFAERIAGMPLAYQPGSTWDYSNSTDVLGRVIEVVTGQSLYQHRSCACSIRWAWRHLVLRAKPGARRASPKPLADDRVIGVGALVSDPRVVQKMESGGGGLVSTTPDYARFLMMLRNGGQLDGRRYLSPRTLEYMTSNHLDAGVQRTPLYLPGAGYGFGLGFAVRTSTGEAPFPSPAGEYYWGGAAGTYMWVDPASDLFVVFMMQSEVACPTARCCATVYASLTEARPPAAR
jgi:CubicO group peptidase (beta-lactamase class C family)